MGAAHCGNGPESVRYSEFDPSRLDTNSDEHETWQIYTAVLVFLAQRLALRKALNTPQTLTALHDKTSAWLGVASSAVSLCQQIKLRTAAWGISGIALYLLGVSVVHISIPGVLEVQVYNATVSIQSQTRLANANYTAKWVTLAALANGR